jgi:polyhydroxybutyrate depolymerase
MGGLMTHQLGCKLPNRIAAIAPVAGTIASQTISSCNSNASSPMVYIHGTLDNVVPYSGVEQTLNFWIQRNNATASVDSVPLPDIDTTDGCTVMKYSYMNSQGVARVVFYKIINGGHTWPGWKAVIPALGLTNRDINGSQEIWNFVKNFDIVVGVSEKHQTIPNNFSLSQNYPNPFNPSTTIKYQIPELSFVILKVYDVLGNEIATLVNEEKTAGTFEITWYAENLSSGVYFYRLQAGSFVETKKMILMK